MSTSRRKLTQSEIDQAFQGRSLPLAISPKDFAELIGVSVRTVYDWRDKGRLEGAYRKRGKHLLIHPRRAYEILFNGASWTDE